jgi:hypothetical protein
MVYINYVGEYVDKVGKWAIVQINSIQFGEAI